MVDRAVLQALIALSPEDEDVFWQLRTTKVKYPYQKAVLGWPVKVKESRFPRATVATAYDSLSATGLLQ